MSYPAHELRQALLLGMLRHPDRARAFAAWDTPEGLASLRESLAPPSLTVAELTESFEASLVEAGFTGVVKDKLGRTYHYQDGKRISKAKAEETGLTKEPAKEASKAEDVLTRVKNYDDVDASHLAQLAEHLPALTVERIRAARLHLGARLGKVAWGGAKNKDEMLTRLREFVRGRMEEMAGKGAGEKVAAEPPPAADANPLAGMDRAAKLTKLATLSAFDESGPDPLGVRAAGFPEGIDRKGFEATVSKAIEGQVGIGMDSLYATVGGEMSKRDFVRAVTAMHADGKIGFGGWPRSPSEIPDPDLASMQSSKILWNVHPKSGAAKPAASQDSSPGFTGTDAQGREWQNGKLVSKSEDKAATGKAAPAAPPALDYHAVASDILAANIKGPSGLPPLIPDIIDKLKADHPALTDKAAHDIIYRMKDDGLLVMDTYDTSGLPYEDFEKNLGHKPERFPDVIKANGMKQGVAGWVQAYPDAAEKLETLKKEAGAGAGAKAEAKVKKSAPATSHADTIRSLYDRSGDTSVPMAEIEQTLKPLDGMDKPGLLRVAQAMELAGMKAKSREAIAQAIKQKVLDRRSSAQRERMILDEMPGEG